MQITKMQLREKSIKFLMIPKSEKLVLKINGTYSLPKDAEKNFSAISDVIVSVNDASDDKNLIAESHIAYALKVTPSLPYDSKKISEELTNYLQPLYYTSFKELFQEIGLPEIPFEKFKFNS